jgi:hypothetical protein
MNRHTIRIGVISAMALISVAAFAGPVGQSNGDLAKRRQQSVANVFLENAGQWNKDALFGAQSDNLGYWVTARGTVLDYHQNVTVNGMGMRIGDVIRMSFVGGHAPLVRPTDKKATVTSYVTRKNPQGLEAISYGEVLMSGIYPGVDERHYIEGGRPRYDLIVRPNADPSQIAMKFDGSQGLSTDAHGDLLIKTTHGVVKHRDLLAYQTVNGKRKPIAAKFVVCKNTVSFKLGAYDRSKAVTIDPLVYGSYFGGDGGRDKVNYVAAEPDGALFMTGWTESPIYPAIQGGYQTSNVGGRTAFLARFRGDAYNVDYNTYLGGTGEDEGLFVSVDAGGNNVWVLGTTTSTDFPVFNNPVQGTRKNATDWFLFRFSKDPVKFLKPSYGSYYSPLTGAFVGNPVGFGIDASGAILIAGTVNGSLPAAKNFSVGGDTPFVTRLNSNAKATVWSRYFGNGAATLAGMAVDKDGASLLTGASTSTSFPFTANVFFGGKLPRGNDSYIAKITSAGNVAFAGVIGGSQDDEGYDVAADHDGNAYVLSKSRSFDFPRSTTAYSQIMRDQVCITKIKSDGSLILASTAISTGGGGIITPRGIAVDGQGNVAITGILRGAWGFPSPINDPPTPNAHTNPTIQVTTAPQYTDVALKDKYDWLNDSAADEINTYDAWLNVFDSNLSTLIYGTYIGGQQDEDIRRPITDNVGDIWVFGIIDTSLGYGVIAVNPTTAPKLVNSFSVFPVDTTTGKNKFITAKAWKEVPERIWSPVTNDYGFGFWDTFLGSTLFYGAPTAFTVNHSKRSDGFVLRFRFGLPIVASVSVTPTTVPGGLGTIANGLVTLSGVAPAEGVTVQLNLDSTDYAFFTGSANPQQLSLVIPAGAQTGTFTITTKPATVSQNVALTANFAGDISTTQFTVVPWLTAFAVTPNKVQGGTNSNGKITLAAAAPTGGVTVNLASSNTSVVEFTPATVTVPAGQNSLIFPISTKPQTADKAVTISASLLGKSLNANLSVTTLNFNLTGVSITPNPIGPLETATATVTIDRPAPDSGYTVAIATSDPTVAAIQNGDTTVVIGPGQTTGTFTLVGGVIGKSTNATITASILGQTKTATVTVSPVTFTVTLDPSSLVGGNSSTGTIKLVGDNIKATKDLTFTIKSSKVSYATVTSPVVIPAGGSTGTFTISTVSIPKTFDVVISTKLADNTVLQTLTVRSIGVLKFTLAPQAVRSGKSTTGTVVLDAPAPAGGIKVTIAYDSQFVTTPATTITVPEGATTVTFTVTAKDFSRSVSTLVSVSAGGTTKSYTLNINP